MKINRSFVLFVICRIGATLCSWCAALFLDDMMLYVDFRFGSASLLIAMLYIMFNSFNNERRKEIQDLHLGIEEVMAINDELRREIDAQKVEKQENP
jgi:bacteriorhodopsin